MPRFWQPISALALVGSDIDGMLERAEEHYETFLDAKPRPHVLDDQMVARVIQVFADRAR